ncbi:siderophore ABC transporter substrate-binding protein [Thermoflavimicrobium daqui]|uniref:ABC transporter n=1 Tax=Thermoflavimicrobium daqui TaxID=2137476 RepID=A0A364K3U9_9BACL|nr:siderophore ABC transporter substrate-binding protein [Thermoflavimicrobium daqui]RAL24058.1 ABC transporter [Thermoflavimicrobium daqui]
MKKALMLFIVAVLSVFAVACGSTGSSQSSSAETKKGEEITIKHKLGETKVKKNPQKVVVFDFGALDSLDKLGVNVTGVPQQGIPSYLSKYKSSKYTNVGGLKEPDFEKINEIGADLIIISGRQAEQYKEFSKIAPTIHLAVDTANYMDSFKENMKTLGKIFDKEAVVDQELAKIEESIKNLKLKATASKKNALIILANDNKVSAYGANSRFGIIHDVFGLTPVDKNIKVSTHGQSISFEYIAEKNPDYLYVIDRGTVVKGNKLQSSAKQVVENELVKNTKAYKEKHIVYLDANYWYLSGGGLVSVAEMAKEIEKSIQ